jgi:hypothetical protein
MSRWSGVLPFSGSTSVGATNDGIEELEAEVPSPSKRPDYSA